MKRLLAFSALVLAVPFVTYAWSGLGDAGAGMTVDYNPGVYLDAVPQTITAGESTYVTLSAPLASDNVTTSPQPDVTRNCTTNFEYDAIPAPGAYPDTYWGVYGAVTDYPTATKTYTATCRLFQSESASGVTYRYETQSVTVTVNPAPAVDVTAAAIPSATVASGQSLTLASTITNVGSSATASGFTTLFQTATDASGTGAQDIGTYVYTSAVPASGSFSATTAHTFSGTATTYVRACADKSATADATGVIAESNESNNCSPWSPITLTPACNDGDDNDRDGYIDLVDEGCDDGGDNDESGEVLATISALPTQIPTNTASTLTWKCEGGATSANIAGIGTVSPASGGSVSTGNLTNASNNFELTCTSPTDTDTDIAVVTTTNPTGTITADPERVLKGTQSTLDWACYPEAVTFSVSGTNGFTASTATGTDIPSRDINTQTTFTLFCDSVAVDTAIVNIEVNVDEF